MSFGVKCDEKNKKKHNEDRVTAGGMSAILYMVVREGLSQKVQFNKKPG